VGDQSEAGAEMGERVTRSTIGVACRRYPAPEHSGRRAAGVDGRIELDLMIDINNPPLGSDVGQSVCVCDAYWETFHVVGLGLGAFWHMIWYQARTLFGFSANELNLA